MRLVIGDLEFVIRDYNHQSGITNHQSQIFPLSGDKLFAGFLARRSVGRVDNSTQLVIFLQNFRERVFVCQSGFFNDADPDTRFVELFSNDTEFVGKIRITFGAPQFSVIWRRRCPTSQNLAGNMFTSGGRLQFFRNLDNGHRKINQSVLKLIRPTHFIHHNDEYIINHKSQITNHQWHLK